MTRLTCKRNFCKAHRLVAPKGYDPVQQLRVLLPQVLQRLERRYIWTHKIPPWFREYLPDINGTPGKQLDFVNGRFHGVAEELNRRVYKDEIRQMVHQRFVLNDAWSSFRESVYRYEHVDALLNRRRTRLSLFTVEDVENLQTRDKLRAVLETSIRHWLQSLKCLRYHQYFYYMLVQARGTVGPHLSDVALDANDY